MSGYGIGDTTMATKGFMDSIMSLTSNIPQIAGYALMDYAQQMTLANIPYKSGFSQLLYYGTLGAFDAWKGLYSNSLLMVAK